VVQGEPGHVLIEMEGQPIIDVVMTTYDEYQQYLENLVQAASSESDVEGRIAEELVKTSQKRDADKGYNDLDPNAPFYYIESSTDVQSSEVHGGSLIDDNDRTWLVRNVLSLAGMNAKH
jgi:5-hydroxyisourate hydrolase-like protein (transthyretin family)